MYKIRKFEEVSANEISIDIIQDLYEEYNKKYFDSFLPKNIKIFYSKLAQKSLGIAKVVWDKEIFSIMLSYTISNNLEQLKNVLLHEMIHIWQYAMDLKSGGRRIYSSPDFFDKFNIEKHGGHNKYFKEWMTKFNSMGFQITIMKEDWLDIEMDSTSYAIHIASGDKHAILWDNRPLNVDLIIGQYKDRFFDEVSSYDYFETTNVDITLCTRLASTGIRENSKNIFFIKDYVDLMLQKANKFFTRKVNTAPEESSEEDSELKRNVQSVLLGFHKYATQMNFDEDRYSYLQQVMNNVNPKEFGGLPYKKEKETLYQKVPISIIELVRKDWEKVSVKDMVKSKVFESEASKLQASFMKKVHLDSNTQENFIYQFNKAGLLQRFTVEEAIEILKLKIEKDIVSSAKRFEKEYGSMLAMRGRKPEDTKTVIDSSSKISLLAIEFHWDTLLKIFDGAKS